MLIKKRKTLASDEDLIKEVGIAEEDTWRGYHGRQKQVRPEKKLKTTRASPENKIKYLKTKIDEYLD